MQANRFCWRAKFFRPSVSRPKGSLSLAAGCAACADSCQAEQPPGGQFPTFFVGLLDIADIVLIGHRGLPLPTKGLGARDSQFLQGHTGVAIFRLAVAALEGKLRQDLSYWRSQRSLTSAARFCTPRPMATDLTYCRSVSARSRKSWICSKLVAWSKVLLSLSKTIMAVEGEIMAVIVVDSGEKLSLY